MTTALEAIGLVRRYGATTVLDHVDLVAPAGTITAVIGPNGAGKTTLFNCLSGVDEVDAGRVLIGGRDITSLTSDARARLGLARTFQHSSVFPTLTVEDNLRVAAENRHPGVARGLFGLPDPRAHRSEALVSATLVALGLGRLGRVRAGQLPTGTLRLVEIARALCLDPAVLLLDEPASGLNHAETEDLHTLLQRLADDGLTLVLVEHDLDLVVDVADMVVALVAGVVVAAGPPASVMEHPCVRRLVLGQPT